jgi:hypothetical protein
MQALLALFLQMGKEGLSANQEIWQESRHSRGSKMFSRAFFITYAHYSKFIRY